MILFGKNNNIYANFLHGHERVKVIISYTIDSIKLVGIY